MRQELTAALINIYIHEVTKMMMCNMKRVNPAMIITNSALAPSYLEHFSNLFQPVTLLFGFTFIFSSAW